MRERGWILRAALIAAGFVIASASIAMAAGRPGGGGDPYGCKAKIRSEMGIAPYTGHTHPDFWPKVQRCRSAAGGAASPATPSTEVRVIEREAKKQAQLPRHENPSPETLHARQDDRDKTSGAKSAASAAAKSPDAKSADAKSADIKPATAKSAALESPSAPVRLPALAKPATVGEFGRRVALVIGNSKYEHVPTLPNATNDAEAVAKALQETGFQSVTLKTDLTRDQMNSALAEFAKVADTADWATVYYSGHGIESRGVNYMIPVDAQLKVDRDVDLETVDASKVLSTIEGARRLRLVILDACRDNPFLGQMKRTVATRSITRGLAPMEPDAGVLIVYSAKHGETALDGDGQHSPFATALINRMQTPNLELRRLFDLVRDDVVAATGHRQQPFSYGSLSGSEDFFFETK